MMDTLLQDLRYALRSLRKSAGYTSVASWFREPLLETVDVHHQIHGELPELEVSIAAHASLLWCQGADLRS